MTLPPIKWRRAGLWLIRTLFPGLGLGGLLTKIGRVTAGLLVAAGLGLGSGVTGLAHAGGLHGPQRAAVAVGATFIDAAPAVAVIANRPAS